LNPADSPDAKISPALQGTSFLIEATIIMSAEEMKPDPARASALISQLREVTGRITAVAKGRAVSLRLQLDLSHRFRF